MDKWFPAILLIVPIDFWICTYFVNTLPRFALNFYFIGTEFFLNLAKINVINVNYCKIGAVFKRFFTFFPKIIISSVRNDLQGRYINQKYEKIGFLGALFICNINRHRRRQYKYILCRQAGGRTKRADTRLLFPIKFSALTLFFAFWYSLSCSISALSPLRHTRPRRTRK